MINESTILYGKTINPSKFNSQISENKLPFILPFFKSLNYALAINLTTQPLDLVVLPRFN